MQLIHRNLWLFFRKHTDPNAFVNTSSNKISIVFSSLFPENGQKNRAYRVFSHMLCLHIKFFTVQQEFYFFSISYYTIIRSSYSAHMDLFSFDCFNCFILSLCILFGIFNLCCANVPTLYAENYISHILWWCWIFPNYISIIHNRFFLFWK